MPYLWQSIMTDHIDTRRKIKGIAKIESFNELIEMAVLTDADKQMLRMHYIDGRDFRFIGDELGYSESTIKKRHKKALQKLSKIL